MLNKIKEILKEYGAHAQRRAKLRKATRVLKADDSNFENLEGRILRELPVTFVLSTGRCGTMYLTKLVENADKNVDVYHKPKPEFFEFNNEAYHLNDVDQLARILKFSRMDALKESYFLGNSYVETSCKTTFFANAADSLFQNARFVHIVREPHSFVKSAMSRHYYNSHYANQSRIFSDDKIQWQEYSLVEKNYWNWIATNEYIEEFKSSTDSAVLTISSDALFQDEVKRAECVNFCLHKSKMVSTHGIKDIGIVNAGKQSSGDFRLELKNEDLLARLQVLTDKYGMNG
ncbi:MAG: hypothetical protein HWE24_17320 [Oceanospirillaceae bacterium]|nr:hypothetical protein [Oceanospirillaceae bacterium]